MTTAIYETWFGLFQRQTAIQLSGAVMFVVFLLFYLERISRGRTRHDQVGGRAKPLVVTRLTGRRALLTALYPLGVVAVAFIYPLTTLIVWNVETFHEQTAAQYWDMVQLSTSTFRTLVLLEFVKLSQSLNESVMPESGAWSGGHLRRERHRRDSPSRKAGLC